jgi:tetratricopeptide (TPR) repeat protein
MKFLINCIYIFLIVSLINCSGKNTVKRDVGANLLGSKAYSSFASGDMANALKYYHKAYVEAGRQDLPAMHGKYAFNIGRVFYEKGQLDSALIWFLRAGDELTYVKDSVNASVAAGFVALVYLQELKYDSVNTILAEKKKIQSMSPSFWEIVNARYLIEKGELQAAEAITNKNIVESEKKRYYDLLSSLYVISALIQFERKLLTNAEVNLEKALYNLDKTDVQLRRWKVLLLLSIINKELGKEEIAVRYFMRAKDCAPNFVKIPAFEQISAADKKLFY